jgi:hypothetical protein
MEILINWRDKSISDIDLAKKLEDSIKDMFSFLCKNGDKYLFVEKKLERTKESLLNPNRAWKYEWNEVTYKMTNGNIWMGRPYVIIDGSVKDMKGFKLKSIDNSNLSKYNGGVSSELILSINRDYSYVIDFVGKLSSKSRKRLIKMMFLYDLKEKSDESYILLYSRLRKVFNITLNLEWTDYKFDYIKKLEGIESNRNSKINKILKRNAKISN